MRIVYLFAAILWSWTLSAQTIVQVITDNTTAQNATPDEQFTGVEDAGLVQNDNTGTYGAATTFEVSKYDVSNHQNAVVQPDLSNIPAGATIVDAKLWIRATDTSGTPYTISAYALLRNWVEAQVTWNSYATASAWGTAGALNTTTDRQAVATGSVSAPATNTYTSIDITSWVQEVVDGGITNNGVVLERTDAQNDMRYRVFASSEGTDGQRPEFVIEYITGEAQQEGFRWGVDDGNEASHTFEAAQDTSITIADSQARLLRVLVDSVDDYPSVAYTLRYQKNGSGGYTALNVGSSTEITPVIEAADATGTTTGAASTTWSVSFPAAASGDLIHAVCAWDDSTTVTAVTAPTGPNSEAPQAIDGPEASSGTEMRIAAWYWVATGSWSATTRDFTPNASETSRCVVMLTPAGEFEAADPIGNSETAASAGTAESNVNSPAFTAGASDGGGRLILAYGSDADAITAPASGTATINNATGGGVGLLIASRNTMVSDSESVSAITATIASDSWATLAYVVRAPTITNEVYITTSGNITSGGEATTARLTAPSGKSTSDFVTGRRWDDENGSDSIDITTDDYTEVEWLVAIASSANDADYFDFRVYAGSSALDTYTVTPRWTIPSAGGSSIVPHVLQQSAANDDEFDDLPMVANARYRR